MDTKRSKYRGVCWHPGHKKWVAKTSAKTRRPRSVTLGYFDSEEDAARMFDVAARYLRGPNANLNFDGSPPLTYTVAGIYQTLHRLGLVSHLELLKNSRPYNRVVA